MQFKLGEKKDCGIIVKSVTGEDFQIDSAVYEYIGYDSGSVLDSGTAEVDPITKQVWVLLEPSVAGRLVFTMEITLLSADRYPETIIGEAVVRM